MKGNKVQERLDILIRRKGELAAALKVQREKKKALERKESDRLCYVIGRALLEAAAKHRDYELMLKSILQSEVMADSSDAALLKKQGWLS